MVFASILALWLLGPLGLDAQRLGCPEDQRFDPASRVCVSQTTGLPVRTDTVLLSTEEFLRRISQSRSAAPAQTPAAAAQAVRDTTPTPTIRAAANPENWPVCQLGRAPIAPGPAPSEALVFRTAGGPVVMSEAGPPGSERQVRFVSCRLAAGSEVYRGADGTLRDLPSNQPFWPVGWDAVPPEPLVRRDTVFMQPRITQVPIPAPTPPVELDQDLPWKWIIGVPVAAGVIAGAVCLLTDACEAESSSSSSVKVITSNGRTITTVSEDNYVGSHPVTIFSLPLP